MSRIGNSPIVIPDGVSVLNEHGIIVVKGKLGELSQNIRPEIEIVIENNELRLERKSDNNLDKSLHGLYRSLIHNMIQGVDVGHTKKLQLIGVGYRASVQGQLLDISVGYSHNIVINIPNEIKIQAETEKGKAPIITLTSHDKQLVGHVAAKIRSLRKPEPYKGKGIRYIDEYVRRKAGKAGAAS
tara:strand:+ start:782 stop:1336 length:555 start_codon:yes stop_codon:yes gene_type:complete